MAYNVCRWTRLCVPAMITAALASHDGSAQASQTHTLKPGETLASLARKYHVSAQDIARANSLRNPDNLREGAKLMIPPPPKRLSVSPTLHVSSTLNADRINLRLGPDESYRPVDCLDQGTSVVITGKKADWRQIRLADGRSGWVKVDFLGKRLAGKPLAAAPARPAPARKPKHDAPALTASADRNETRKRTQRAAPGSSRHLAKKHRDEQHPKRISQTQRRQRSHQNTWAVSHKNKKHLARTWQKGYHSRRGTRYIPEAERPEATTDVVRTAYAYRGTPYRYGGAGRGGFDCSGFTSYLYAKKGVSLPHTARGQFQMGHKVDRGGMKPGDLVFFHTVTSGISHVGVYAGNGKFVHASSRRSGGVRVDSLDSGYYKHAFRGARRMKN